MNTFVLYTALITHFYFTTEVEIPKAVDDRIYHMFLDPTGRHLVISMLSSENYYLSRNSKKPKQLGKLRVGKTRLIFTGKIY